MTDFISILKECGVIAVLRNVPEMQCLPMVQAILSGGIRIIEVTMDNPHALNSIERLRSDLGSAAAIGAGTVTTIEQMNHAADAGASFLVSPHLSLKLVERAVVLGIPYIPGVLTPTELVMALEAGLNTVKVFPAATLGPNYIRDLSGPFPFVNFIPTGGITVGNAGEFISAGAAAVGIGGALLPRDDTKAGLYEGARSRATSVLTAISVAKTARSGIESQ